MAKRITKVITKKGDKGSTAMGDGSRVSGIDNFKELLEGYKDANLRDQILKRSKT